MMKFNVFREEVITAALVGLYLCLMILLSGFA
jgi:hypothetical protein